MFCMHFGARISHLRAHLTFGFWLLASLGFTWLHLDCGSWLLVLVSLGFGFGRSLHMALGWVLVL